MSHMYDWLMLPDIIFTEVMMKIVLESFESLHRCRQVCKSWNEMIMTNIWESSSKKEIIKTSIEKIWDPATRSLPSDEQISHAKWLGRDEKKKFIIHICSTLNRS